MKRIPILLPGIILLLSTKVQSCDKTGAEISFNTITLGFNAQLPLAQNFAESQTQTKIKRNGACEYCTDIERLGN